MHIYKYCFSLVVVVYCVYMCDTVMKSWENMSAVCDEIMEKHVR